MSLEYKFFSDYINLRGQYGEMRPGSNLRAALKRFTQTLGVLMSSFFFSFFVPIDYMLTPEYFNDSSISKLLYLVVAMHVRITALFTKFCFVECNSIATGQGYQKCKDGIENFNSIR